MNYRVSTVRTPEEQMEWFGLREVVYVEAGILTTAGGADEVYTDRYDDHSVHFLVRDETGAAVATSRLILGSAGPLQVADTFDVEVAQDGGEFSGFAVVPEHRDGHATVLVIGAVLAEARRRGIEHLYGEVEAWLFDSLCRVGYPLTRISEAQFVYNSDNFAFHASVEEAWEVLCSAERCSA